jgi:hypothetical protein
MGIPAEQQAATPAPAGRMPDFFIVGHAKCGTTALYEMLRRHPQVYMPDAKEPMFFARNWEQPPGEPATKTFEQTGKRSESLTDYLSLFAAARPDQRVGEASTFYLWSPPAPQRIAEAQPGSRIIAILREPASFVRSLHMQMIQNQAESEPDLLKALALEPERRSGRQIPREAYWPAALIYSDRVRYAEQLRRYHAVFPREQVLVLIYEDFRRDNEGTVRTVQRFLEVDDTQPIEVVDANPTVGVRAVRADLLLRTVRSGRGPAAQAVRGTVKALTSQRMRSGLLYPLRRKLLYAEPAPADEQVMAELRRRFKGEVEALSEYLDRDFLRLWGYDRLD